MKKFVSFFSAALFSLAGFWGCEKDFNNVVDFEKTLYQVDSVYSFDSKKYILGDSTITLQVKFISDEGIKSVFADIYSSADIKLNSNSVVLLDNGDISNGDVMQGDKIYSSRFPLSKYYPNGNYRVEYFVLDKDDIIKKISIHYFEYYNNQINIPPAISNLIIPNSIARADTFIFNITASDPNGLMDVLFVYFQLYRPDGTVVEENPGDTIFSMHDDGNSEMFGDEKAGDGIYSFKNSFSSTAQTGTWRFGFQAIDRQGDTSSTITHNIIVE